MINKFIPGIGLALLFSTTAMAQPKIIAHRGYWDCEGSAQNSIAALNKAHELKVYGAEFDVHLTKDGIAVINHDDTIGGLHIEESTFTQLKHLKLANGEKLPTLAQYLEQGKKNKGTKLILEIKPHKTKEAEDRAVKTVLALVKQYKVTDVTEYISFSLHICQGLLRQSPGIQVAYLRGELPPADLKKMGFTGLDYHYSVMNAHPDWIKEAHELGLSVNVWTVNEPEQMKQYIDQHVDFITTNKPVELGTLLRQ